MIDALPKVGFTILGAGPLLALWCVVHSVGGLMLIKSGALLMTQHIAQSQEATN
ncbi:MAG: hypothetical protein U1F04_08020 [Burkholderiaceae bacterium]